MKYIFLLAVVALGSATTLYGVQREIKIENDKIVVRGQEKIVVIDKTNDDGVLVFVKEHDRSIKKIIIDKDCHIVKEVSFSVHGELPEKFFEEGESNEMMTSSEEQRSGSRCRGIEGDRTQMDCLLIIFKKYEGVVTENKFKELINDIKTAVDNKECHPVILEVLKGLQEQTSSHNPLLHFWRFHWGVKDTDQNKLRDQQKRTELFRTEQENQATKEDLDRQNRWVRNNLKNSQEEVDDTFHTTGNTLWDTQDIDCSTDAMTKQLVCQNNIREIQGQIYQHQLKAQQLQLQQQFLNHQKQKIKLQIMTGRQHNMPWTQMQDLNRVRLELHQKEEGLLEMQKNIQLKIQKLHQNLVMQEERLQKCLVDERKGDERIMEKMF